MRMPIVVMVLVTSLSIGVSAESIAGDNGGTARVATATPIVDKAPKFRFILFWKDNDAATQAFAHGFESAVANHSERAEWGAVNVSESANKDLVERYDVEGEPLPLVLCVAPNGVITGHITPDLFNNAVERALVTPAMLEVAKAVQDKKFVIVHITQDERSQLSAAASDLIADPAYQARTELVNILLGDPAEKQFLNNMGIRAAQVKEPILMVLAPPGILVGRFSASVTKEKLAGALQAAEKRSNDAAQRNGNRTKQ